MRSKSCALAVSLLASAAQAAQAAQAATPVPGHGPYPAVMDSPASLATHTVYRPADLKPFRGSRRLPVIAWGEGGCGNLGNRYSDLLGEIASHGYLVVAVGPVGTLPPDTPRPQTGTPQEQLAARVAASEDRPPASQAKQLSDAIDWAVAQDRSGPLAGRIDRRHIAAMGHSCGGLQAIATGASDKRVTTTVLLNSGIFRQPNVAVDKDALDRLTGPIAYFIGGSSDIAYVNAEDDFARIAKVPVMKANSSFGHGGKLREPFGGPAAPWIVDWLDWRLRGDAQAARAFTGSDCDLCRAPGWSVARKGF